MASAANASQSMNSSINGSSASSSLKDASKGAAKSTTAKMTQKGRKESPSDSNRQTSSTKAWTGSNPTIQRSTTPNQPKNTSAPNKPSPVGKSPLKDGSLSEKQAGDRLRYFFGGAVGVTVVLTTKAGDKFEGLFAGYTQTPDAPKVVLKMTKAVPSQPITQPNGNSTQEATFTGSGDDFAMTFDLKDMADMTFPEYSIPEPIRQANGNTGTFRTDVDISGNMDRSERTLQRWVPENEESTNFSLEAGSATNWDQFATHQQMTGGQSTYSEEQYTTSINRNAPDFKEKEARAARLAREIEAEQSTNTHVREERGQAAENDGDEEEKYSGVRRDVQPLASNTANKYTPPALRAPSNQQSLSGAPFDPAIISSQLARGDKNTIAPQPGNEQPRATSMMHATSGEPAPIVRNTGLTANGAIKTSLPVVPSTSQQQPEAEQASQGVESKVLEHFRQFANQERTRLADRKLKQATQDRTAKINDLVRFSKTFKLKTPIPNDLVGILAKDPKKQADIVDKAIEDAKTSTVSSPIPGSSVVHEPPTTKFDKSQIPPPIPDRSTFTPGRAGYGKPVLGRGVRPTNQGSLFPGQNVPIAPRNPSIKNGQIPPPIPMPDLKNGHATSGNSGLSSPRGIDTPTSTVSSKFNVRASEFRPTAQTFNPSTASVSAASPSPIKRTASIARAITPTSFFGQRKPKKASEKLGLTEKFNPITKLKETVQADLAKKSDGPVRDFKANGGIPNAFHTQPVWLVAEENQDKSWDDSFKQPPPASPAQHRGPYQGQMQPVMAVPMMSNMPHHGHPGGQYQHFDDQRMHMQNGTPQPYASNMTPRSQFVSPMNHHAQPAYGQQPYFMNNRNMGMQGYGGNPGMIHGHSGQLTAPMMVNQHSSGPYLTMQPPNAMMYSPGPGHAYPQHVNNGYPSPGRQMQAPAMMHQGSQQGYHTGPPMYGGSPYSGQQRPSYGGQPSYGTSPHQPHAMNQRAMSSGYMQKAMPQMTTNGGVAGNGPQQSNSFSQMPLSEEGK